MTRKEDGRSPRMASQLDMGTFTRILHRNDEVGWAYRGVADEFWIIEADYVISYEPGHEDLTLRFLSVQANFTDFETYVHSHCDPGKQYIQHCTNSLQQTPYHCPDPIVCLDRSSSSGKKKAK